MSLQVRRVVTGHDANGRAVVKFDEISGRLKEGRPGAISTNIWTTATSPADNSGDADSGAAEVGTMLPGGTVFRVIEFKPGVARRMHRTDSIDYLVVMSGEIDMQLDDGVEVHIKAGDVMVQRGTIHNWVNRGTESCIVAVVLVHAHPVQAGGKVLEAIG
jgi:quercetin dioxygenase-like cupin family protein